MHGQTALSRIQFSKTTSAMKPTWITSFTIFTHLYSFIIYYMIHSLCGLGVSDWSFSFGVSVTKIRQWAALNSKMGTTLTCHLTSCDVNRLLVWFPCFAVMVLWEGCKCTVTKVYKSLLRALIICSLYLYQIETRFTFSRQTCSPGENKHVREETTSLTLQPLVCAGLGPRWETGNGGPDHLAQNHYRTKLVTGVNVKTRLMFFLFLGGRRGRPLESLEVVAR